MSELQKFRLINKIEGISFIILLFIAMPLKYSFGYPIATKIVGMLHGLLVFAFIYQIIEAKKEAGFTLKETALYSILSLIPFGSFYTDKLLEKKIEAVKVAA
jgi:integral membrane protein